METTSISTDQIDIAQQIASSANERLDAYSLGNATRALNLSCSMMALPGFVIVLVVFLLSRFNWVMAAIALTLVGITAFLLANLASSLARNRSVEKLYTQEVQADIQKKLLEAKVSQSQFNQVANDFLPENSPLKQMIEKTAKVEEKEKT